MKIEIPALSLVVLIGPSGSGKSTFARKHFRPTEVLSSDTFRGLVSDDENDQDASVDAFETLHFVARKRLSRGRLVVVDATNVQAEVRKPLLEMAREQHVLVAAIVLDLPERVCQDRNAGRPDRAFGPHVVRNQCRDLARSRRTLEKEGFRQVYRLTSPEDVDAAEVVRTKLWNDRREEHGPFDIVGDVHGCLDELLELARELGYVVVPPEGEGPPLFRVSHPDGRRLVLLGDLVDRGPDVPGVLRFAMGAVASGAALCVPGNHDVKLLKKLRGRDVRVTHGLAQSLEQLEKEPEAFREEAARFIDGLVSHYVLDDGRLVVAHAGLKQELQGRASARVREFCLFGETTGETDEYGLPVRHDWAATYRGRAMVVYGHTPVAEAEWLNNTICVDTGCVFGGRLTALRYPERELVSVPSAHTYYEPARPFLPPEEQAPALTRQQEHDEVLDLADVLGKRVVATRLKGNVVVREENARAALEAMSRFAEDPRWLVYLPPTMSPCETSAREGFLEHPAEAFAHYRHEGVPRVVCEEKHMGSRAVLVVCRDEDAARRRFGGVSGAGTCVTRTGRRFFDDEALAAALLDRVRAAATSAGLWDELGTDWLLLDAELMPWSAKAQQLLRTQYAPVGVAATSALARAISVLESCTADAPERSATLEGLRARASAAERYVTAWRGYCWPVAGLADLKLAPFHLLASQGAVHTGRPHAWHLDVLGRLAEADRAASDPALLLATRHLEVDVTDPASEAAGTAFWEEITSRGGEGMAGYWKTGWAMAIPASSVGRLPIPWWSNQRTSWPAAAGGSPSPRSRCAARSTCASSTGPSTRFPGTSSAFAGGPSPESARSRSASWRWGSRGSSAS